MLHRWLIRSQGTTILLDTGAGNGKERPYAPAYAHHDTAYLDNLRAAGVSPEDVDIVINTHLHVDHVGWNTRLEGRDWVPTFPNARYLIGEPDFLFWDPIRTPRPPGDGNQNVFEDSVRPLQRAGLVELWAGEHRINSELVLQAEPGHTPGSAVLRVRVRRRRRPVRRRHPALARADRRSRRQQLFLRRPGHGARRPPPPAGRGRRPVPARVPRAFRRPSACRVDDDGDGAFIIRDWADLARI